MKYLLLAGTVNEQLGEIEHKVSKLSEITDGLWNKVINFGVDLLIAILIFVLGKIVLKLVRKFVGNIFKKSNIDAGAVKFIDSIVKILGYIVIVIIICGQIGIQTTSFITLLGTAGVSIGLALQGSLSNFAGGILILVGKPFVVGNYIKVGDVEGIVSKIDIIYTTLQTGDNKIVKLPNGTLSNSVLTNFTYEKKRRVDLQVGIHYEDDIKKAVELAKEVAMNCPYVLKDENNTVIVKELADSCVNLEIRMWTETANYWPAKFYLNETIKDVYDKNDIHIPYNQLDVHLIQSE